MIRLSHETPNTTRRLVATMRIDRNRSLDETQQQTRVPRTVKSTQQSRRAVRVSRTATSTHAPSLKLATDLARGVLSVLPMRLYNARGLVRPTPPMNLNSTLQTTAVHATRESNFEVAVYLKMTRKKNTEKSRTSRHATVDSHTHNEAACGIWRNSQGAFRDFPRRRIAIEGEVRASWGGRRWSSDRRPSRVLSQKMPRWCPSAPNGKRMDVKNPVARPVGFRLVPK